MTRCLLTNYILMRDCLRSTKYVFNNRLRFGTNFIEKCNFRNIQIEEKDVSVGGLQPVNHRWSDLLPGHSCRKILQAEQRHLSRYLQRENEDIGPAELRPFDWPRVVNFCFMIINKSFINWEDESTPQTWSNILYIIFLEHLILFHLICHCERNFEEKLTNSLHLL